MLRSLLFVCCAPLLFSQTPEIQKILQDSEAAWNRGDLVAFVSYYNDAPDTTFIGREVTRGGTQAILDRYRRAYPTAEARGTLMFSEIEIRTLGPGVALAIGKYSLKRTAS